MHRSFVTIVYAERIQCRVGQRKDMEDGSGLSSRTSLLRLVAERARRVRACSGLRQCQQKPAWGVARAP
jgi:hypothetical protein